MEMLGIKSNFRNIGNLRIPLYTTHSQLVVRNRAINMWNGKSGVAVVCVTTIAVPGDILIGDHQLEAALPTIT